MGISWVTQNDIMYLRIAVEKWKNSTRLDHDMRNKSYLTLTMYLKGWPCTHLNGADSEAALSDAMISENDF